MFTRRDIAVATSVAVAALTGFVAPGAGVTPPETAAAAPATMSVRAYPQTKPSAGQFCKRAHRGVVTRAANGRMVRCTAEGSRSRWKYTR